MKVLASKIIALLVIVSLTLALSGCVTVDTYRGIVSEVKCNKALFCKVENLEQRYIEVSFTITINNDGYTQKELLVVAQNEKGKELYQEICVFGDDKQVTIHFEEYSDLFKWAEGLANTSLQTKKIVVYDGDTVVGSAKIDETKVFIVIH